MELQYKNNGEGWQACESNPLVKIADDGGLAQKTPAEIREFILSVEGQLSKHPMAEFGDTDTCPLKHTFAPGVYVREMFIPKGTLIVGKIHKHDHPVMVMSGDISVLDERGGVKRIKGPASLISKAGAKRIGYAHEDTVWINIHVTEETDLDKIEEVMIAKTYSEYEQLELKRQLI